MNRTKMKNFANWLEKNAEIVKIDMAKIINGGSHSFTIRDNKMSELMACGTTACACGWYAIRKRATYKKSTYFGAFEFATDDLELTEDEALSLFTPNGYDWRVLPRPKTQLNRLLKVLRGQIEFTPDWLFDPVKVKA